MFIGEVSPNIREPFNSHLWQSWQWRTSPYKKGWNRSVSVVKSKLCTADQGGRILHDGAADKWILALCGGHLSAAWAGVYDYTLQVKSGIIHPHRWYSAALSALTPFRVGPMRWYSTAAVEGCHWCCNSAGCEGYCEFGEDSQGTASVSMRRGLPGVLTRGVRVL